MHATPKRKPGAQPKAPEEKRTANLQVRLTETEAEALRNLAEKNRRSLADQARCIILDALESSGR